MESSPRKNPERSCKHVLASALRLGNGIFRRSHPRGDRDQNWRATGDDQDSYSRGAWGPSQGFQSMSVHEQFADDLSLYALGALRGDERHAVQKHLEECSACRQELEKLQGDLALLAFSASGPRPPARSRERLMAAVAKEPRKPQLVRRARWAWWNVLGWAAALAAIAVAVLLSQQNSELRHRLAELETSATNHDQQLREARQL